MLTLKYVAITMPLLKQSIPSKGQPKQFNFECLVETKVQLGIGVIQECIPQGRGHN